MVSYCKLPKFAYCAPIFYCRAGDIKKYPENKKPAQSVFFTASTQQYFLQVPNISSFFSILYFLFCKLCRISLQINKFRHHQCFCCQYNCIELLMFTHCNFYRTIFALYRYDATIYSNQLCCDHLAKQILFLIYRSKKDMKEVRCSRK